MSTDKQPPGTSKESNSDAMTLEEIAMKASERKILGSEEQKFDPNILAFVGICFGGLIIINAVLYFLISGKQDYQFPLESEEFQSTIDARGLLRERLETERPETEQPESSQAEQVAAANVEQDLAEIAPEAPTIQPVAPIIASDPGVDSGPEPIQESEVTMDLQVAAADVFVEVEAVSDPAANDPGVSEPSATELPVQEQGQTSPRIEVPYQTVISVGAALNDWAAAWSAKDADAYLSHYSSSFISEAGLNIDQWRELRTLRLAKPEWIQVGISKLRIELVEGGTARAEFLQEYNASNYADKEVKVMIFENIDGVWKVLREQATPYQES